MTSISKLIIGNFKSIRERTEIKIAPITLMFGPNSAGKSAVLGAIRALLQRIEEPANREYSFREKPPPAIESGTAYIGPDRRPFAEEGKDQEFSNYPNITLGVEIEDFPSQFEPENLLSWSSFAGRALYWAMDGSSVQIEISEFYWEDLFRDSFSSLQIDQLSLLKFHTASFSSSLGQTMTLDFDHTKQSKQLNLRPLGTLSINLNHPIWLLNSITDGTCNFDARLDKVDAVKFDHYRIELLNKIKDLRQAVLSDKSSFINKLIAIDGNWINIRANVDFLRTEKWTPNTFYSSINPSYEELWEAAGLDIAKEIQCLPLIQQINEVLESINQLSALTNDSFANHLRISAIDGDRQILKPDDLSFRFPEFYATYLTPQDYWRINFKPINSTRNYFSLYTGPEGRTFLALYAFWLGSSAAKTQSTTAEKFQSVAIREDFVNEILKLGVFGTRKYEVKPEVWSITTKKLLSRATEPVDEEDEEVDIKVQLYLEDQNGRRLDFSEVGSGISYVMPILASLHGAKISWIAQPELHLHPAAQCEMGDVFLRAFNRGHYSVIETHSEHVLLRILRRIRETTKGAKIDEDLKCPPEAVSVLYFDPQNDGSTIVQQLRVSRLGDFKDRWPNGFFEERARELFDE